MFVSITINVYGGIFFGGNVAPKSGAILGGL